MLISILSQLLLYCIVFYFYSSSNWFLFCILQFFFLFIYLFLQTQALVWICIHAYAWRWLSSLPCVLFGSRVPKYVTKQFACQACVFERRWNSRLPDQINVALYTPTLRIRLSCFSLLLHWIDKKKKKNVRFSLPGLIRCTEFFVFFIFLIGIFFSTQTFNTEMGIKTFFFSPINLLGRLGLALPFPLNVCDPLNRGLCAFVSHFLVGEKKEKRNDAGCCWGFLFIFIWGKKNVENSRKCKNSGADTGDSFHRWYILYTSGQDFQGLA